MWDVMNAGTTFVLSVLILSVCGTFLVYTEHYGWAWIPLLAVCSIRVKNIDEEKKP